MQERRKTLTSIRKVAALAVLILLAIPVTAVAQSGDANRDDRPDGVETRRREQIRERLHGDIERTTTLTEPERAQMRENLETCLRLGLGDRDAETLFACPQDAPRNRVQAQLRHQNRVRVMLEAGLPPEPVVAKLQEGRLKNVPEPRLEPALDRMEEQVRSAHRVLQDAERDGLMAPADPERRRDLNRNLARDMWQGLSEEDVDQLRERTRDRARDGSCDLEDLMTAAGTVARLQQEGVQRDRALQVVGDALEGGYRTREMRELRHLVMASHRNGTPVETVMDELEVWLGNGLGSREMMQRMMQQGWLGPGDMRGPGGQHPSDGVGGGPGDDPGRHGSGGPGDPGSGSGGTGGGSGPGGGSGDDPPGGTGSGGSTGGSGSGGTGSGGQRGGRS